MTCFLLSLQVQSRPQMREKPLIFVSCGQYSKAERNLGRDVCDLLRRLRPDVEPYFAENQSSAEGLSSHILKALFRSAGFICIMHSRGEIKTPENNVITRGSVWLEQEIAVVAFMQHQLSRSIPALYYKQKGVCVEGIRSFLLMNARIEFTQESQVLEDLTAVLPETVFNPYAEYDVIPVIENTAGTICGDRHNYLFVVDLKNVGKQKITDFELRVFFPRAFIDPQITRGLEVCSRSTPTHICLVAASGTHAPNGLYPNDRLTHPLTIYYFIIDSALFRDTEAIRSEIRIELFSGSMEPKRESRWI